MDTTTYNDIHIFKGEERETIANFVSEREHEVNDTISLVKSLSGDIGYFAESWNNHLAAIADFSDINSSNISKLYDKTFSFVCHLGCGETFQFTLQNSTTDSATGRNSSSSHHYYIGIANATNGSDIVTSVMNCIQTYPVSGYGTDNRYNLGGQQVSHAQFLTQDGPDKLVVYTSSTASAQSAYNSALNRYGRTAKVDFSQIMSSHIEGVNRDAEEDPEEMWELGLNIRPSDNTSDRIRIYIPRFHVQKIRLDEVHIDTEEGAHSAISDTSDALNRLNRGRSLLGAQQNRLESSIDVNQNTEENTDASESKIRDTDFAKEYSKYTKLRIIENAGRSVLAQAMDLNVDSVMSLLA